VTKNHSLTQSRKAAKKKLKTGQKGLFLNGFDPLASWRLERSGREKEGFLILLKT
jgi:hypothetical protein